MPGQVATGEARRRTAELRRLSAAFGRRYALGFVGCTRPAVVEGERRVITDNYLRVRLRERTALPPRQNCQVHIERLERPAASPLARGLSGTVLPTPVGSSGNEEEK